jgi:hypothetical protein
MLTFTYEKYYSMMNSPQLSLQVIKNMSSMKNLLSVNLNQNSNLTDYFDDLNKYVEDN